MTQLSIGKKMKESSGGGLDLSCKQPAQHDPDSEQDESDDLLEVNSKVTSEAARTSRRKPLAPQWLNPTWDEEQKDASFEDKDDGDRTINGVCVVNNYSMFGKDDKDE